MKYADLTDPDLTGTKLYGKDQYGVIQPKADIRVTILPSGDAYNDDMSNGRDYERSPEDKLSEHF